MAASILFEKYSGCGNDFIIIDNRNLNLTLAPKDVVRLCHRQHGIGADGVILLEPGSTASFRMRIYNADGSEAEMCGNGLRCLARFIYSKGNHPLSFPIETMHATMNVTIEGDLVSIDMPPPAQECREKVLSVADRELSMHHVDTGVPHAILFTDDIDHPDLLQHAPHIRHHEAFHPRGTNVNYAKILPDNTIAVRTYERGVEAETLACGTGATAVALAAAKAYNAASPVTIRTRSTDCLHITFEGHPSNITKLVLTGPATKIFEGSLVI